MTQENEGLILDQAAIQRKLRRMAYEIFEHNANEKSLILAGIFERGLIVATRLAGILSEIASFDLKIIQLVVDKKNPTGVNIPEAPDFNGKVVIVVDDVADSGRTLLYALKPLLDFLPKKIQTAVLVDRMHKSFPIVIDYTGHSLSTTLKENILVKIDGGEILGAFLS